jgi:UDP-glucose 4-epimerase
MSQILVTGGTGYIGSHTVVELLARGYEVLIVDNLSNSQSSVLNRIEMISGKRPTFIQGDLNDVGLLDQVFSSNQIEAVIHFAGLKAVGESVAEPLLYYRNNVAGSISLFDAMQRHKCNKIVFSSSSTVYGEPEILPVTESAPLSATNPYGQTKLDIENILRSWSLSNQTLEVSLLRYFNPVGAHKSSLIGEQPNGIPNNLMPFVTQVAAGKREVLSIFGDDYDTPDGTAIRDYIHVADLAKAHIKALEALNSEHGCQAYNLGTGRGYSVLEVVQAFERVNKIKIPYQIVGRRDGDVPMTYASPAKSEQLLNWRAEFGLDDMVRDHWSWQSKNPNGYDS